MRTHTKLSKYGTVQRQSFMGCLQVMVMYQVLCETVQLTYSVRLQQKLRILVLCSCALVYNNYDTYFNSLINMFVSSSHFCPYITDHMHEADHIV